MFLEGNSWELGIPLIGYHISFYSRRLFTLKASYEKIGYPCPCRATLFWIGRAFCVVPCCALLCLVVPVRLKAQILQAIDCKYCDNFANNNILLDIILFNKVAIKNTSGASFTHKYQFICLPLGRFLANDGSIPFHVNFDRSQCSIGPAIAPGVQNTILE